MRLDQWQEQRVRFVCACFAGFSTNYALLFVLTQYVGWWHLASASVSLAVGYSVTFVLQKIFTFEDNATEKLARQVWRYVEVSAIYYAANVVALFLLVDVGGMPYLLAQPEISMVLTAISFGPERRIFVT